MQIDAASNSIWKQDIEACAAPVSAGGPFPYCKNAE